MKGLYLVADRNLCGEKTLEDVVLQAARGGAACVQLREKKATTRVFISQALRIKELLTPFRVPLIINDRVDVALAARANGVHLGQDDMSCRAARKLLGPEAIIGLSVETWEDVEAAEKMDPDYLGVSPVFQTPTKPDTKGSWGIEGVARIRAFSRHPLVAIGGLNLSNAAEVVLAGADAIAVVSAICSAPDPFKASRDLHRIIAAALEKRSPAGTVRHST